MKLLVYLTSNLNSGGAEWNLGRLAVAMSKSYRVVVITMKDCNEVGDYLVNNKVRVINLGAKSYFDIFALYRLRRLLRFEKVNILHSWHYYANYWASIGSIGLGLKHLSSIRGISERMPKLTFFLTKLFSFNTAKFLCNSNSLKDQANNFGIKKDIEVIYNAICLPKSMVNRIVEDSFRVLYLGRRTSKKGLDTLVQACSQLINFPIKVNCIGRATSYEENLKLDIKNKNVTNLSLLAEIDYNKIGKIWQNYHLLVLPSVAEGLPNVVCEAMANGLPVLVSDIAVHKELVERERGYLFEVGNSQDLANKIIFIYQNYNESKEVRQKARRFIKSKLSEEVIYQEYKDFYDNLVKESFG